MHEADRSVGHLRVAALISDMDGVLIDSGGIYDEHWERWAARQGLSRERIKQVHFGRPAAETIRLMAPHLDAVEEARRFNDHLAADPSTAGILPLPGALALAAGLPSHGWAIATSAPRVMAERWLAIVGLARPDAVVTADDVARGKPAPDPYLRAAELLGVPADACLVIEDAPVGIAAAKAAGATVLGVLSTHAAGDLSQADHLVADLREVQVIAVGDAAGGLQVRWRPAPR
jgi:mannitol-1-/sugar-/sorbitol-6-phosphatase